MKWLRLTPDYCSNKNLQMLVLKSSGPRIEPFDTE